MTLTFSISSLRKREELDKDWDVIIIGGGPAGLTSALYCGRYKLKTLVITREVGGLLLEASVIEDYPGIKRISGSELAEAFKEHALEWGTKILEDEVIEISKDENTFYVITKGGYEFSSKAIIFATGSARRKLNVPGEEKFTGKGVSYCAECDAPLFKDKIVAVVGGGNSAFHDALVLVKHAKKVYLIHRRDQFRADPVLVDELKSQFNVEFLLNKVVVEMKGKDRLESVILKDTKTGELSELKLDGVFIAIGLTPVTELAEKLGVELDERKHIKIDQCMRTNIPGIFAAGEVTNGRCNFGQIITVAAEGAIAALNVFKYLIELKRKSKN